MLGSGRHRENKPFRFKWPKVPIPALGIFIPYDKTQNKNQKKKKFLLKSTN